MLPKSAVDALQFLAQPHDEKLRQLPASSHDIRYGGSEDSEEMVYPAEAAFKAAAHVLRDLPDDLTPPLQDLLKELRSLMDLIVRMADLFSSDFWWVEKEQHGISAADDDLWLVLQRLARLALQVAEVPSSTTWDFNRFIRDAGFTIWRIERHPL